MAIRWLPHNQSEKPDLLTLAEYDALTPWEQGYVHFYQAAWPDSPIPREDPYVEWTTQAKEFKRGNLAAMNDKRRKEQ